ncbi:MAG TPA: hypothetical protein VFJ96_05030 [Gemmatimonadaceae bacterium]|nr:hypothetical protein [Gemmatimonadaceae bacterium]
MLWFASGVALLHALAGGGVLLFGASRFPFLAGLTGLAYVLGLRHGFDADHIAAIDGTTRALIRERRSAHGVGFFFSLGHSTVVFALALALALGARAVRGELPAVRTIGGLLATAVSGLFLYAVAILNLFVFLDALRAWRRVRRGPSEGAVGTQELAIGGPISRVLGRVFRLVARPWHMYIVGLLFGLGFDTASEIALLAISALAASRELPVGAVLTLPVAFAAGMSLVDTIDGALMARAYRWATAEPLRRVTYNLVVTGVTVAVALLIGSAQLAALAIGIGAPGSGIAPFAAHMTAQTLGIAIVAIFAVTWLVARLATRRAEPTPDPVGASDDA